MAVRNLNSKQLSLYWDLVPLMEWITWSKEEPSIIEIIWVNMRRPITQPFWLVKA